MRHLLAERKSRVPSIVPASLVFVRGPAFQSYTILRATFAALLIVAGSDKFFHELADWNLYLAPALAALVAARLSAFMRAVGAFEIAAGLLVAIKPRWGGPVAGLWLLAVFADLLLAPGYHDVALRDLALAAGALALSRLSAQFDR